MYLFGHLPSYGDNLKSENFSSHNLADCLTPAAYFTSASFYIFCFFISNKKHLTWRTSSKNSVCLLHWSISSPQLIALPWLVVYHWFSSFLPSLMKGRVVYIKVYVADSLVWLTTGILYSQYQRPSFSIIAEYLISSHKKIQQNPLLYDYALSPFFLQDLTEVKGLDATHAGQTSTSCSGVCTK